MLFASQKTICTLRHTFKTYKASQKYSVERKVMPCPTFRLYDVHPSLSNFFSKSIAYSDCEVENNFQNDNELYCGGFGVQHFQNKGRCGICGDPWHKHPRENEAPEGLYANGIISKIYKQVISLGCKNCFGSSLYD